MSGDPRTKQLRIKAGVVKRLVKEKASYEKEAADLEAKLKTTKASGADSYVVRKAEEVLSESKAMVPDCARRLAAALAELEALVADSQADLAGTNELLTANEALQAAHAAPS